MATLADINATLQLQTEAIGRQADATAKSNDILDAVRQRISDMLTFQQNDQKERRRSDERARKTSIENKRETTKTPLPKTFMAGFAQGTGFSWLSDFLSGTLGSLFGKGGSLLGLLAGVIGKAAGKLLIWGVIGTLVANFFGDEIKAFVEKFKEYTGIDINEALENTGYKEEILAAATLALGALTLGVTKALAKIVARATLALGGGLLSALGFGAGAAGANPGGKPKPGGKPIPKPGFFQRLLKGGGKYGKIATGALALGGAAYGYFSGGSGGAPDVIPPVPKTTTPNPASVVDDVIPPTTTPKAGTPNPASVVDDVIPPTTQPKVRAPGPTSAQRAALAAIPDSKLPVGFARNAAGKVYNTATGKLAKTSEILDLLNGVSKYAKYAKLIKFLGAGANIIPALIDPAFAILEDQPKDVIKTQLAGALGSISGAYLGTLVGGAAGGAAGSVVPVLGTGVVGFLGALGGGIAGAVYGEEIAEELANFLLGDPVKPKKDLKKPGTDASGRPYVVRGGQVGVMGGRAGNLFVPNDGQTSSATDQRERRAGATLPSTSGSTLATAMPLPSTSGSTLAAATQGARATYLLKGGDTYITNPPAQGGGNQTSILTMPITTRDGSDYRDTIRRYGVQ